MIQMINVFLTNDLGVTSWKIIIHDVMVLGNVRHQFLHVSFILNL